MIDKTREIALKALYEIEKEDTYSNIELDKMIKANKQILNSKDIGLISEIVYGVTSWKLTLDEIIKMHSKVKIKKISTWILNILRMGIYQIIFLDKIPKSAAVNESVNLSKKYGHKASSNFVNAILRKVDENDYKKLFKIEDDIERISKTTSMPEWIVKKLLDNNSKEIVEEVCKNLNLKPKTTIRINALKTNKKEFVEKLKEQNIEYEETNIDKFLILNKVKNIENLELFKEGLFTIQDLSAGLTAITLAPKPNEKVLDVCAAPGGKTTHIAELMKNEGYIEAWDIHEHRIKMIEDNSKRLGIKIIKTKINDATKYKEEYIEKFDKILLDVPCLGIGVIKRKPDIKWHRNQENIEEITDIQKNILGTCSKYLKPDGELVYSTCSILKEENQDIIEDFVKSNKQFEIIEQKTIKPSEKQDGFFIAKIKKI